KSLNHRIDTLQQRLTEAEQHVLSLKGSSQKERMEELRQQLSRLNHELITVKTKQEQYQAFIANSQNRKQDIEQKLAHIAGELQAAEPRLETLKSRRKEQLIALTSLQDAFQDVS